MKDHAQIKAIFLKAIEMPLEERFAYVLDACGQDKEMVAAVMELLDNAQQETLIKTVESPDAKSARFDIGRGMLLDEKTINSKSWWGSMTPQIRFRAGLAISFIVVLMIGWWCHKVMKENLFDIRAEVLEDQVEMAAGNLKLWIVDNQEDALEISGDSKVLDLVSQLMSQSYDTEEQILEVKKSEPYQTLMDHLNLVLKNKEVTRYAVMDQNGVVLLNSLGTYTGHQVNVQGMFWILRAFSEGQDFFPPMRVSDVTDIDHVAENHMDVPVIQFVNEIKDEEGKVIALFFYSVIADEYFGQLLTNLRRGNTGEVYAFSREAVMLSPSRFEAGMEKSNRIAEGASATCNLELRVPPQGQEKITDDNPILTWPITEVVAHALTRKDEVSPTFRGLLNTNYRDYRGKLAQAAWCWLPEYNFGIVAKMDAEEAYAPMIWIDAIFAVLLVVILVLFIYSWWANLKVVTLKKTVGVMQKMGQYTLIRPIGEGGMGEVYLARHAMLKRPTAIKILKKELADDKAILRFEREVQLASQLRHPNTIAIYDYGRTEEGVFYYAMEYLEGLNLKQLVNEFGPLPQARVLSIMKQVCGSLREAHAAGLVHRDIKPQNIILCIQNHRYDVAKVLDFGLIKPLFNDGSPEITAMTQIGGTPAYMAPERFRAPAENDLRSDIYALGAVAYLLLSGESVIPVTEQDEIIEYVLKVEPQTLEALMPEGIDQGFSELIADCLRKDRLARPQSTDELMDRLESLDLKSEWTEEMAAEWWKGYYGD